VYGKTNAWIGAGSGRKARVLLTTDRGRTWKVADTPLKAGPSAGIFSVAFRDARHGVVAGGDYTKEKERRQSRRDKRRRVTWTLVKGLSGYRSVVAYVPAQKHQQSWLWPIGRRLLDGRRSQLDAT